MKNKIIENFYQALKTKDVDHVLFLSEDLFTYMNKYTGSYKTNGLLKKILMVEWSSKEVLFRDKALIQSAKNYFIYLKLKIEMQDFDREAYLNNWSIAIADLKSTFCRLDGNIDYDFILANTNRQNSSVQFQIAKALFYQNKMPKDKCSKYNIDHIAIPFLRAILETKIKSVLGLDIVLNKNLQNIDLVDILRLLPEIKSIKLDKAFDYDTLQIIMKWLNHYMHRNLRPEPYVLHEVIQYLVPIFKADKIKNEKGTIYSIHSSAYVDDLNAFQIEIEQLLQTKFPDCQITWGEKEVASFRKNIS